MLTGAASDDDDDLPAVSAERLTGAGDWIVICDHASNRIPARYAGLGLSEEARASHAAWDPGAAEVTRRLSASIDAPCVLSNVSRLVVDCNRAPDAPDIMRGQSEIYDIPANRTLDQAGRDERMRTAYDPFHTRLSEVIAARPRTPSLIAIHSFTPVYNGITRPWEIGVLFDTDRRLADHMLTRLRARGDLNVGENEPYAPSDGVYWTLDRHGTRSRLPTVMIEIRNDLISTEADCTRWARILMEAIEGWTP
uniref:N-formylglutamate amidohydrolase n=1 Tax=Roseovarius indicus TaxID=540747 RepID=UPI003B52AA38